MYIYTVGWFDFLLDDCLNQIALCGGEINHPFVRILKPIFEPWFTILSAGFPPKTITWLLVDSTYYATMGWFFFWINILIWKQMYSMKIFINLHSIKKSDRLLVLSPALAMPLDILIGQAAHLARTLNQNVKWPRTSQRRDQMLLTLPGIFIINVWWKRNCMKILMLL